MPGRRHLGGDETGPARTVVADAPAIARELTDGQVKGNLGGSVHYPTDPVGKLLFTALAMVAEFEADLARMRTREGMRVAKAKVGCAVSDRS